MDMQLDTFQVLANPTRRSIVQALRKGERQVNDVVEQARIHQSGVSRNLRILLQTGFVSMRPAGQRRFYELRPERFRELDHGLRSTAACGRRVSTTSAPPSKKGRKLAKANPQRNQDERQEPGKEGRGAHVPGASEGAMGYSQVCTSIATMIGANTTTTMTIDFASGRSNQRQARSQIKNNPAAKVQG